MSRTFKPSFNLKHLLTNKQGQWAEEHAEAYLRKQGLKLVLRNYSCSRGEIDLIMMERNALIFIEVRYRKDSNYGGGIESIDYRKQQKIQMTAQHYLQAHDRFLDHPCRIDAVIISGETSQPVINWIKNAF